MSKKNLSQIVRFVAFEGWKFQEEYFVMKQKKIVSWRNILAVFLEDPGTIYGCFSYNFYSACASWYLLTTRGLMLKNLW